MKKTIKNKITKGFWLFLLLTFGLNAQNTPINDGKKTFTWKDVTPPKNNQTHNENEKATPIDIKIEISGLVSHSGSAQLEASPLHLQIKANPATESSGVSISLVSISDANLMSTLDMIRINNFIQDLQNNYGISWGIGTNGFGTYTPPEQQAPPPPCDPVCSVGFQIIDCKCTEIPKDPCNEVKKNDAIISNTVILNQNSNVRTLSTSIEYGAEQNLNVFPPATTPIYNTVAVRPGAESSFTPNFTWNAKEGYTIGFTHGHPGGSGPSPADILLAYKNLSHPDLIACGQVCIDYYRANFAITVVTQKDTFIINIKNWTELGLMYEKYYGTYLIPAQNVEMLKDFQVKAEEYIDEKGGFYESEGQAEPTLYAGLQLYGNVVSIAKFDKKTSKFIPLAVDTKGEIVTSPCFK